MGSSQQTTFLPVWVTKKYRHLREICILCLMDSQSLNCLLQVQGGQQGSGQDLGLTKSTSLDTSFHRGSTPPSPATPSTPQVSL